MHTVRGISTKLLDFWSDCGCTILSPCTLEIPAGTLHPATFFGVLSLNDTKIAYIQPSIRPHDSRLKENPNRLYQHHQLQVIIQPSPDSIEELYLKSLIAIGIDTTKNDVQFVPDNWKNDSIGAYGKGWEIWHNGLEISQITYMYQMGGQELQNIALEITYGIERIAITLQQCDSVYELNWDNSCNNYRNIFADSEYHMAHFARNHANIEILNNIVSKLISFINDLLEQNCHIAAYNEMLKLEYYINILEARGALSVIERQNYIRMIKNMSQQCAIKFMALHE